jgi:hypothetical protein
MFTPSDVISGSSSTCEFIFRWWPTVGVESNAQARMQQSPARSKRLTAACREVIAVLSKHESTLEHLHKKTMQRSGLLFHCIVRVRTGRLRCWCAVLLAERRTQDRAHATWARTHVHARPCACKTARMQDRAHARPCARTQDRAQLVVHDAFVRRAAGVSRGADRQCDTTGPAHRPSYVSPGIAILQYGSARGSECMYFVVLATLRAVLRTRCIFDT